MLIDEILSKENMETAYKRVRANRGAPGIDGITVEQLGKHLVENWEETKEKILAGIYKPAPVRRVEIPKSDGTKRMLGIPNTTDRLIQQAVLQKLSPIFEKTFSNSSYGFRPERRAHDAVFNSKKYIEKGYIYVVDIDISKFFDNVNHDRLMARVAKTIEDKTVLKLIRRFLQAGVMTEGIKVKTEIGTPQGGPLSPLLANIVLDELDKELERRGHKFSRYADDCNIYVKTPRAGERVMEGITKYIETKLKLGINQKKSAVDKFNKRQFLGFSFYKMKGEVRITIPKKIKDKLRRKIKKLTSRSKSKSTKMRMEDLNKFLIGWLEYYKIADIKTVLITTEENTRRRLRMCIWKQWKRVRTRYKNLKKLGKSHTEAIKYANTRKGYWRISGSAILTTTLTNKYLSEQGLIKLVDRYQKFVKSHEPPYTRSVRTVV